MKMTATHGQWAKLAVILSHFINLNTGLIYNNNNNDQNMFDA